MLALDPIPDKAGWAGSCEIAEDWDEVYTAVRRPTFRVVLQEEIYSREQAQDQLEHAVRVVRSSDVGNCVLLIDELSPYFKKGVEAPDSIQGLVRFGRRQGVSCVLISQRAYDCPVEVRSQLTDLYVFRLVERDIEHLSSFLGKANIEPILSLSDYQFVHYDLTRPFSGGQAQTGEGQKDQNDDETRVVGDADRGRKLLDRRAGALDQRQPDEAAGSGVEEDEEE